MDRTSEARCKHAAAFVSGTVSSGETRLPLPLFCLVPAVTGAETPFGNFVLPALHAEPGCSEDVASGFVLPEAGVTQAASEGRSAPRARAGRPGVGSQRVASAVLVQSGGKQGTGFTGSLRARGRARLYGVPSSSTRPSRVSRCPVTGVEV